MYDIAYFLTFNSLIKAQLTNFIKNDKKSNMANKNKWLNIMLDILLVKIRMDRGFREDLSSIHFFLLFTTTFLFCKSTFDYCYRVPLV